jgi:hypothetical protein
MTSLLIADLLLGTSEMDAEAATERLNVNVDSRQERLEMDIESEQTEVLEMDSIRNSDARCRSPPIIC